MFLGLKWQAFLAFYASAISKESLLGVLNTLYGAGGNLIHYTFGAKAAGSATDISQILSALLVSCIVYHVGLLFF